MAKIVLKIPPAAGDRRSGWCPGLCAAADGAYTAGSTHELLPGGPAPARPAAGQAAGSGVSPVAPGMCGLNYCTVCTLCQPYPDDSLPNNILHAWFSGAAKRKMAQTGNHGFPWSIKRLSRLRGHGDRSVVWLL